jgi:hypothetical protein
MFCIYLLTFYTTISSIQATDFSDIYVFYK